MPREKVADKKARAAEIERLMYEHYGEGACSLDYLTPFQLTVAVVLSAQCTDAAVNKVTPTLFAAYPDAAAMAQAKVEDIEDIIHSLGFFRSKARNLVKLGQTCLAEFGGEIPNDLELLQRLPGVGRKTANVIASVVYDKPVIAVDTHVFRVSHRLGLSDGSTPFAVEQDLERHIEPALRPVAHHWLILHGRYTCTARNPKCSSCPLTEWCREFPLLHPSL